MNALLAHALISLTRVYKRIPARPTLPFYAAVLRPRILFLGGLDEASG